MTPPAGVYHQGPPGARKPGGSARPGEPPQEVTPATPRGTTTGITGFGRGVEQTLPSVATWWCCK